MILLSTVVAPAFTAGKLIIEPVELTPELLRQVDRNLCGHPVTVAVLTELRPDLPKAEKAFWDGTGMGLAVRPKGGVRGAQAGGDTPVTLADLEAVVVVWAPRP